MQDKIALLMEETGCDRGEAELALEMCGYEVEEAVKAIPRLLKNIAVVKARFVHPEQDRFGLLLVVLNVKSGLLLRARAVLSFNPAAYSASLEKDWFEFEKYLYGCRLWEGSLQAESFEIEQALFAHFRERAAIERLARLSATEVTAELSGLLQELFKDKPRMLQARRDILDVGQFNLRDAAEAAGKTRQPSRPRGGEDLLVLKVALDESGEGVGASELRVGDVVHARITDARDIAQYLAKLFGGHSDGGPVSVPAPIEAIESMPKGLLARVRFSVGVCGDALVSPQAKVLVSRSALREAEGRSWWRRFFRG
jgi:hypothetical protein